MAAMLVVVMVLVLVCVCVCVGGRVLVTCVTNADIIITITFSVFQTLPSRLWKQHRRARTQAPERTEN